MMQLINYSFTPSPKKLLYIQLANNISGMGRKSAIVYLRGLGLGAETVWSEVSPETQKRIMVDVENDGGPNYCWNRNRLSEQVMAVRTLIRKGNYRGMRHGLTQKHPYGKKVRVRGQRTQTSNRKKDRRPGYEKKSR